MSIGGVLKSNLPAGDIMLEPAKHIQTKKIVIHGTWYGLPSKLCGIIALFRGPDWGRREHRDKWRDDSMDTSGFWDFGLGSRVWVLCTRYDNIIDSCYYVSA